MANVFFFSYGTAWYCRSFACQYGQMIWRSDRSQEICCTMWEVCFGAGVLRKPTWTFPSTSSSCTCTILVPMHSKAKGNKVPNGIPVHFQPRKPVASRLCHWQKQNKMGQGQIVSYWPANLNWKNTTENVKQHNSRAGKGNKWIIFVGMQA